MADTWTWLALAGAGALHGLDPIAGWGLVAAADAGLGARLRALPALAPIALGHAAGVALLAGGLATGRGALAPGFLNGASVLDAPVPRVAACVLLVLLPMCARRRLPSTLARCRLASVPGGARSASWRRPWRRVALATWSCAMSLGHGTGLTLVPMMMATCSVTAASASSGAWTIAAVAAVHTSAMLATSAVLVLAGRRVAGRWTDGLRRRLRRRDEMPDPCDR